MIFFFISLFLIFPVENELIAKGRHKVTAAKDDIALQLTFAKQPRNQATSEHWWRLAAHLVNKGTKKIHVLTHDFPKWPVPRLTVTQASTHAAITFQALPISRVMPESGVLVLQPGKSVLLAEGHFEKGQRIRASWAALSAAVFPRGVYTVRATLENQYKTVPGKQSSVRLWIGEIAAPVIMINLD